MRNEYLTESKESPLELSPEQVGALRAAGRRLASSTVFWGDADDAQPADRNVISCVPNPDGTHSVRIAEAVGVVALPGLQLFVTPKIPDEHFLYLLSRSTAAPRVGEGRARLAAAATLWDLVATWYVDAAERVVRRGLLSDYHEEQDLLSAARGTILPLETTYAYYSGNLALACEYEEFGLDAPLNRVLRAAALQVSTAHVVDEHVRQRARRLLARFEGVSDLQPGDLRATVDRRSHYYRDALTLAHQILAATGRSTSDGNHLGWTFLVRTPELVEDAVRRTLAQRLEREPLVLEHSGTHLAVSKTRRGITGSGMSLNPDLVFSDVATGDVKYKLNSGEWLRPDLYQAVAFATGFDVQHAVVVTFGTGDVQPGTIEVGQVKLRMLTWDVSEGTTPESASERLDQDLRAWFRAMDLAR